jgi:hypothetical protein
MKLFRRKKRKIDVDFKDACNQVQDLETRVQENADRLIDALDDPWARNIIKAIHAK